MMPRMNHWNCREYYSLEHDADVSRVSGFDEHGREFWSIIETGKGYRDRRTACLEAIMEHIENGGSAGEVV